MSFTNDIDQEVDNIIVNVVNDNNDNNDNSNKIKRNISVHLEETNDCDGECDNCECENLNENNNETEDNKKYINNDNKLYVKHLLTYLYISYLFMNGFYKSVVHSVCPQYYKKDIKNTLLKLNSKINKKEN
jgi:hypothetical protein